MEWTWLKGRVKLVQHVTQFPLYFVPNNSLRRLRLSQRLGNFRCFPKNFVAWSLAMQTCLQLVESRVTRDAFC